MNNKSKIYVGIFLAFQALCVFAQSPPSVSRSFEMRYFTNDPKANGETDFKGKTTIFTTEQRIEYLQEYAKYATQYFNDPHLDKPVVSVSELHDALKNLKPQPLPECRQRIPLTDWRFVGHKPGKRQSSLERIQYWSSQKGVEVDNGNLLFTGNPARLEHTFDKQDWRMNMEFRMFVPKNDRYPVAVKLGDAVEFGISKSGNLYYGSAGKTIGTEEMVQESWVSVKIELDMEYSAYNLYLDDKLIAGFVPLHAAADAVSRFTVTAGKGFRIDNLRGVGYRPTFDPDGHHNTRDVPFSITTYIDEGFRAHPDMAGWQNGNYDDREWSGVPFWPYAHGGERYKDEDLYLRTKIQVKEFKHAELKVESLFPAGELWVNGEVVEVRDNAHPFIVDISRYLIPHSENLIAVRVRHNKLPYPMRHTPADEYSGWYAGRMWLNLTGERRITDLFAYTQNIDINKAELAVEADLFNGQVIHPGERERKEINDFNGKVRVSVYPWFPIEGTEAAAEEDFPVRLYLGQTKKWKGSVAINNPNLWTPETPQLYKIRIQLLDNEGRILDDEVITTGIRTVSQEGGTFRINGKPAMMNGAMIFNYRDPLEHIAQYLWCPPIEGIVTDLLMLKKMNANMARMSIHDGPAGSCNDPRHAEVGDQLGIMFQWTTSSWVRTDSPYLFDFEGFPAYIRQVRNHPSIVMWQTANHPRWNNFDDFLVWLDKVYALITANDTSRLISPSGSLTNARMQPRNDKGTLDHEGKPVEPQAVWTAPLITRGSMDWITGYSRDWSNLRNFPYPESWSGAQNWLETGFRSDFLASEDRAYFDFESEESTGQPNWNLYKGKPQYRVLSYELVYDEGRIGRLLSADEWLESQAYQAMSAFEAYKKKRLLDYDGLAWCTLRGGGNTATYQKPVIDYFGQAKLAFHTVKMSFQPILAGSDNVDVAYGPDDQVTPVIINLGPERTVGLEIKVKSPDGKTIDTQIWNAVQLNAGRSVVTLPAWRPDVRQPGYYILEYNVTEGNH